MMSHETAALGAAAARWAMRCTPGCCARRQSNYLEVWLRQTARQAPVDLRYQPVEDAHRVHSRRRRAANGRTGAPVDFAPLRLAGPRNYIVLSSGRDSTAGVEEG